MRRLFVSKLLVLLCSFARVSAPQVRPPIVASDIPVERITVLEQAAADAKSSAVTIAWAVAVPDTLIRLEVVDLVIGLRLPAEEEAERAQSDSAWRKRLPLGHVDIARVRNWAYPLPGDGGIL